MKIHPWVLIISLLGFSLKLSTCFRNSQINPSWTRRLHPPRSSPGTWLPIASVIELGSDLPKGIEVCGEKLVIWKSNAEFAVMRDICSHRQAPLSEGRVDPTTQCLECPYHGIQFNDRGLCTKIPQLEPGASIPEAMGITSFPVRRTGDMIWAKVPLPGKKFPTLPEEVFPLLSNVSSFTTRDLPYSLDYLLENFMDPAHIPFAHHSLQVSTPLYSSSSPAASSFYSSSSSSNSSCPFSFILSCFLSLSPSAPKFYVVVAS
jgi:phenylpropionate dioxygenase-like ring-hydroxylating dioxygenase large terminal subunit